MLVKTAVVDLRAQLVLMTEFSTSYVQEGYSRIAATYTDFKNAVDFIGSLNLSELK